MKNLEFKYYKKVLLNKTIKLNDLKKFFFPSLYFQLSKQVKVQELKIFNFAKIFQNTF